MSNSIDVKSLSQIMQEQIDYYKNSDTINLLWAGYLAALSAENDLDVEDYHKLNGMLKDVGREELHTLLVGYPGQFE